uniref:Uncharacterized protein n=1 Tax=Anopheles melas TaxID=34690 RepID=A0A182UL48_9DIPT
TGRRGDDRRGDQGGRPAVQQRGRRLGHALGQVVAGGALKVGLRQGGTVVQLLGRVDHPQHAADDFVLLGRRQLGHPVAHRRKQWDRFHASGGDAPRTFTPAYCRVLPPQLVQVRVRFGVVGLSPSLAPSTPQQLQGKDGGGKQQPGGQQQVAAVQVVQLQYLRLAAARQRRPLEPQIEMLVVPAGDEAGRDDAPYVPVAGGRDRARPLEVHREVERQQRLVGRAVVDVRAVARVKLHDLLAGVGEGEPVPVADGALEQRLPVGRLDQQHLVRVERPTVRARPVEHGVVDRFGHHEPVAGLHQRLQVVDVGERVRLGQEAHQRALVRLAQQRGMHDPEQQGEPGHGAAWDGAPRQRHADDGAPEVQETVAAAVVQRPERPDRQLDRHHRPDGGLERFQQLLERAERLELLRHGQHQLGRVVVVRLRGGGEQGRVGEVAADRHVDGVVQQQPERPVRRAVRVDAAPGPPVRRLHDRDAKVELRGEGGGDRSVPFRRVHKLQEGGPLERRDAQLAAVQVALEPIVQWRGWRVAVGEQAGTAAAAATRAVRVVREQVYPGRRASSFQRQHHVVQADAPEQPKCGGNVLLRGGRRCCVRRHQQQQEVAALFQILHRQLGQQVLLELEQIVQQDQDQVALVVADRTIVRCEVEGERLFAGVLVHQPCQESIQQIVFEIVKMFSSCRKVSALASTISPIQETQRSIDELDEKGAGAQAQPDQQYFERAVHVGEHELLPAPVLVRVGQEPQLVVLGGPPVQQPGGDEPLQQLVQRPEQRGRPLRVDGQLGDGYALARNAQQLAGARQIPVQKRDRFERQQHAEPRARPLQPADNRRAELVRRDELDARPDVRVSVEGEAVVPVHVQLVAGVQQGRQVGRHGVIAVGLEKSYHRAGVGAAQHQRAGEPAEQQGAGEAAPGRTGQAGTEQHGNHGRPGAVGRVVPEHEVPGGGRPGPPEQPDHGQPGRERAEQERPDRFVERAAEQLQRGVRWAGWYGQHQLGGVVGEAARHVPVAVQGRRPVADR